MKLLIFVVIILFVSMIGMYFYFDNIIEQKNQELDNIQTRLDSLPINFNIIQARVDSIKKKDLLDSLKKAIEPKVKVKIISVTDPAEADSLRALLLKLEQIAMQYKDSVEGFIEYADTTIQITAPCKARIEFWGKPFSIFTIDEYDRYKETTVKTEYVEPESQILLGVNLGSYYTGKLKYGLHGAYLKNTWGLGVDVNNGDTNMKFLKSINFYKENKNDN